ncbi:hypothetical protein PR048_001623 [Dryococelus australis]|uniref:DDE-1 domain-containing protein n=1 Tax=Dryococelus australis TaxID=614101 RepID=A0ABQ9II17_9NEOP|nr:hypothetical protein PR048_001623 [Dryococelus australis]
MRRRNILEVELQQGFRNVGSNRKENNCKCVKGNRRGPVYRPLFCRSDQPYSRVKELKRAGDVLGSKKRNETIKWARFLFAARRLSVCYLADNDYSREKKGAENRRLKNLSPNRKGLQRGVHFIERHGCVAHISINDIPEASRDWMLVGRKTEEGASGKDIEHMVMAAKIIQKLRASDMTEAARLVQQENFSIYMEVPENLSANMASMADPTMVDDYFDKLTDTMAKPNIQHKSEEYARNVDETGIINYDTCMLHMCQWDLDTTFNNLQRCSLEYGIQERLFARHSNPSVRETLDKKRKFFLESSTGLPRPLLLLMDSHESHITSEVIELSRSNDVHMLTFQVSFQKKNWHHLFRQSKQNHSQQTAISLGNKSAVSLLMYTNHQVFVNRFSHHQLKPSSRSAILITSRLTPGPVVKKPQQSSEKLCECKKTFGASSAGPLGTGKSASHDEDWTSVSLLASHLCDPGHSGFSHVGMVIGDLPFPSPFHSGTAPYSHQSPSSALKTHVQTSRRRDGRLRVMLDVLRVQAITLYKFRSVSAAYLELSSACDRCAIVAKRKALNWRAFRESTDWSTSNSFVGKGVLAPLCDADVGLAMCGWDVRDATRHDTAITRTPVTTWHTHAPGVAIVNQAMQWPWVAGGRLAFFYSRAPCSSSSLCPENEGVSAGGVPYPHPGACPLRERSICVGGSLGLVMAARRARAPVAREQRSPALHMPCTLSHNKGLLTGYSSASCKQSVTESRTVHRRDSSQHWCALSAMRVIEVRMELRRNAMEGEAGDPRENLPTSGIVRQDSHMRKSGVAQLGIEPGLPCCIANHKMPGEVATHGPPQSSEPTRQLGDSMLLLAADKADFTSNGIFS